MIAEDMPHIDDLAMQKEYGTCIYCGLEVDLSAAFVVPGSPPQVFCQRMHRFMHHNYLTFFLGLVLIYIGRWMEATEEATGGVFIMLRRGFEDSGLGMPITVLTIISGFIFAFIGLLATLEKWTGSNKKIALN
ncbi:MAG: hypothetical protein INQ03_08025 [Candidatus Heimdallarchaeota archaeon]|nr:hypothetical protein [Candidatus Heimdallarchaeota archaeon]